MIERGRYVWRDGQGFVPGRASPELLREDLRKLPSDLVTKDEDDGEKIHAEDAEHIQLALHDDYIERARREIDGKPETLDEALPKLRSLRPGESMRFTDVSTDYAQWEVDVIRMRMLCAHVDTLIHRHSLGETVDLKKVFHVWFPANEINAYERRDGNPPANLNRPGYLKGIDLACDLMSPPARVRDALRERGVELDMWDDAVRRIEETDYDA